MPPNATQPTNPASRLLPKLFWFSFVVTFVFITVLFYGYTLVLREALHDHELGPTASTIGSQATQAPGVGGIAPNPLPRLIADSLQRAAALPTAPQPRPTAGYQRSASPNEASNPLSPTEVIAGTLAGDPYATAQSFIAVGLLGTLLFGAISAGLYLVSSRRDYTLPPPAPRPRGPKAYAPPLDLSNEK
jgi:hypothetical protein